MCSVYRCLLATFALFVTSAFFCEAASSQSFKYAGTLFDPIVVGMPAGNFAAAASPCIRELGSGPAARPTENTAGTASAVACEGPPQPVMAVKPCKITGAAGYGCEPSSDPVQAQLAAMGKAGQKILRAREKILEILETESACKNWFQEKDSNPAATFRTLSYILDSRGDEFVLESKDIGRMNIFRNPYVAKVMQGDGPYAAVTLNAKGAFFSTMATVVEVHKEGGPTYFRGTRLLRVGPYAGDTLPAQVITLLHEFGHVLDLLPTDLDDLDGKSGRNTNEVLRACSAEVEAVAHRSLRVSSH